MKSVRRVLPQFGITLVLAILIALPVTPFVDRRDEAVAVMEYLKNPSMENGGRLAAEHAKTRRAMLLTRIGIGTLAFVIMNIGWVLVSRNRRG